MISRSTTQQSEDLFGDLDRWVIKQRNWKVYSNSRRLLNCDNGPRSIPFRGQGGFISETWVIYRLDLLKTQFIKIPDEIEYFYTYPTYIDYCCTLFDTKNKQFFGRSFRTIAENRMKEQMYKSDKYLMSSKKDQILFYLHDCDINDTCLVVEISIKCEKTNPQLFSMGFFLIDLLNHDNRSFLISKSPRVLLEEEGDKYLKEMNKVETVPELLYSIDSDPILIPVSKIVGANTIFCLRELMAFLDIKFKPEEIKDLDDDEKFELKCSRILSGLKDEDFFPPQTVIFSNIELLVYQNLELKIEELEVLDYLYKTGKINSNGVEIQSQAKSKDKGKSEFGIDILDTRLVIRVNNTWKDIQKYSISLDKEYVKTKRKVLTKYTSKGSVVIDKFEPHMLEAFVFSLEYIIKVPTYTDDDKKNDFVEKTVEVANFVYLS